jgi:hypothetical protein
VTYPVLKLDDIMTVLEGASPSRTAEVDLFLVSINSHCITSNQIIGNIKLTHEVGVLPPLRGEFGLSVSDCTAFVDWIGGEALGSASTT